MTRPPQPEATRQRMHGKLQPISRGCMAPGLVIGAPIALLFWSIIIGGAFWLAASWDDGEGLHHPRHPSPAPVSDVGANTPDPIEAENGEPLS
ncbi:hypothetical protein [Croceicoccus sp. YJ47]|uniref:hypothetical protein n=1 Tax=Croceicoccus sp. YJ47 TaxID=2798724 RepID=UPI00192227DE|nr:hypothetical protein [Croceicoccus sp. YJ47]QQN73145.1 hypothetical protein JD971_09710 [Croceicoccus sp. YJ47]